MLLKTDSTDAHCAEFLQFRESVRSHPGMFIGNVHDGSALHQMLWLLVDHALEEHVAGFVHRIRVTLHDDGSASVEDDGRGGFVELLPSGISLGERVLTFPHWQRVPELPPGLDPKMQGISLCNAVSSSLSLEVRRDGKRWSQEYRQGVPRTPLLPVEFPAGERSGTTVRFAPDLGVFSGVTSFHPRQIRRRLEELAFLFPTLTLEFYSAGEGEVFHAPHGLVSMVLSRCGTQPVVLPEVVYFSLHGISEEGAPMSADVAIQWLCSGEGSGSVFLGAQPLNDGGSPLTGSRAGAIQGVYGAARWFDLLPKNTPWSKIATTLSERLVVVVRALHKAPRLSSRTRGKMCNSDMMQLCRHGVTAQLRAYLQDYPDVVRQLLQTL